MASDATPMSYLFARLNGRVPLSAEDHAAIEALPHHVRNLRAGEVFVREGERATHCCLMLDGFTFRHKIVGDRGRQILALHIASDLVDLQNSMLDRADHNVQALTPCTVSFIPRGALQELAFGRTNVGKAMWLETLVDGSIFREWIANVGRRDARKRIAHFLCEIGIRLEAIGMGTASGYELPMTQEQLADVLGLTPVHVNRTLMGLDREGLTERTGRSVRIANWKNLAQVGDFDPAYLHLPTYEIEDPATRNHRRPMG